MLSIRNVVKQYSSHRALDNVSIEIEKGRIFGLLGPNGAGKTSLIRIINQIIEPDEGEVLLNGERLNPSHIPIIGYLPEERGLYRKMEIGEQLLYLAQLKGVSRKEAATRVKYWFEKLEMQGWWKKKVSDLSKGMQQKVQFIAAVIHQPQLIILDEPFSGFDPVNAETIKKEILRLNEEGATIIFSTHRMETVEELCDSIALIHKARLILNGKVKDIRNSYHNNTYRIRYTGDDPAFSFTGDIFSVTDHTFSEGAGEVTLRVNEGFTSNDMLGCLIPNVQIHQVIEVVPTIHDIFIEKVKKIN
ncbi:MAG TPA: ATP-binding cassette domain-containing protein [Chitinophaga sp.]|nr:ATP-binding cassette domain-containing protein [Chitinophaga sp.]